MNSPMLKVAFKWTGILAGFLILLSLINYIIGTDNLKGGLSILTQILWGAIIIIVLVMSGLEYRKKHLNGFMKYGQALGLGLLISLFSLFAYSLFYYIFYQFIDYDSFVKTMEFAIEDIQNNDRIPAEYKEETLLKLIEMTPLSSAFQFFWVSNIFNFILMLIIAIFTKKKNSSFEETFKDVM